MNSIHTHRELVLALLILAAAIVSSPAAQHRATRLGDPAHRFAPPLTKPEDLRTLLLNDQLKDDIASILDQAGWKGNLDDLRNAAAVADIVERKLPKGTVMPFMSSRNNGLPIALMEVEWIGREPIEAYAFEFKSNHRLYRLVTPKPCSNFFVEDLGPEPPPPPVPAVKAILELPPSGGFCDTIPTRLTVRNTGTMPLTRVQVQDVLGPGLTTSEGRSLVALDGGDLAPGTAQVWTLNCKANQAGTITNVMRVSCAEKVTDTTMASMTIHAPRLITTCSPPSEAYLGRPVKVCATVVNTGDAADPAVTGELNVPPGATFVGATEGGTLQGTRVTWPPRPLEAGATMALCATFSSPTAAQWSFHASSRGSCATESASDCTTAVTGIAALLLEVIDTEDPLEVGKEESYQIRVTNQGTAPGTRIQLRCTLEDSQEFVSGSGTSTVRAEGASIRMEPLATLAPKAVATWRVVVKAVKPADVRFAVELTSDQLNSPVRETEATRQY